jgi:hypothetical protein
LHIHDAVTGGTAIIAGGTMEFDAASSVAVTFNNGTDGTSYGVLILIDPSQFTGDISGFAGTAPDAAHSDVIDVIGINFNSGQFSDSYNASTGVLTLSDGTNTDSLTFVDFNSTLVFAEDSSGTGTLITDPPDTSSITSTAPTETTNSETTQSSNLANTQQHNGQSPLVTIGGPDGDHFVFAPDIGAETATNFNAQQYTNELEHFVNAQTVQELQSLVTAEAHGDAMINLTHNDGMMPTSTAPAEWHQFIQPGHVLLH